jgi:hypothetical protein
MKTLVRSLLAVTALSLTAVIASQTGVAQVPAGAPAGTTGLCNDGSYWTGASKSGACRGHKGVKTWYAASGSAAAPAAAAAKPATPAPAPAPAPPAKPATTSPAPTPAPASAKTKTAPSTTPAPGGGPGLVWLNTSTKVYHCSGTKYYGTTKAGAYMTEADAKAKGAHPDAGKPCS